MCLAQTEHTSSNVMVTSFRETLFHIVSYTLTSSETQGQIVGARESLNGRENMARRKVKNGQKSSSRRSLLFFVPYFPARLDFPLPPLSALGLRGCHNQGCNDIRVVIATK